MFTRAWLDRHIEKVPYNAAVGIRFVRGGDDWIECAFEWEGASGPPPAGHIITLLDATCGAAVLRATRPAKAATLSLRVEHHGALPSQGRFLAHGRCHRISGTVAFVNALVHCGEVIGSLASASACFYFDHA